MVTTTAAKQRKQEDNDDDDDNSLQQIKISVPANKFHYDDSNGTETYSE